MTAKQELHKLLEQVPDEAVPQVASFLKDLAAGQATAVKPPHTVHKPISIAQQTFGLIPSSAAMVRQVMAEDLYETE